MFKNIPYFADIKFHNLWFNDKHEQIDTKEQSLFILFFVDCEDIKTWNSVWVS